MKTKTNKSRTVASPIRKAVYQAPVHTLPQVVLADQALNNLYPSK